MYLYYPFIYIYSMIVLSCLCACAAHSATHLFCVPSRREGYPYSKCTTVEPCQKDDQHKSDGSYIVKPRNMLNQRICSQCKYLIKWIPVITCHLNATRNTPQVNLSGIMKIHSSDIKLMFHSSGERQEDLRGLPL